MIMQIEVRLFPTSCQETNSGLRQDNCMGWHASTGGDSSGDNAVFGFSGYWHGTDWSCRSDCAGQLS